VIIVYLRWFSLSSLFSGPQLYNFDQNKLVFYPITSVLEPDQTRELRAVHWPFEINNLDHMAKYISKSYCRQLRRRVDYICSELGTSRNRFPSSPVKFGFAESGRRHFEKWVI